MKNWNEFVKVYAGSELPPVSIVAKTTDHSIRVYRCIRKDNQWLNNDGGLIQEPFVAICTDKLGASVLDQWVITHADDVSEVHSYYMRCPSCKHDTVAPPFPALPEKYP